MFAKLLTIEAVYENGLLRPVQPLPLKPNERVTITLQLPPTAAWPADVAEIYKDIEAETE